MLAQYEYERHFIYFFDKSSFDFVFIDFTLYLDINLIFYFFTKYPMTKKKLLIIAILILLIPIAYKVYTDISRIYGKKQAIPPQVLERMNHR